MTLAASLQLSLERRLLWPQSPSGNHLLLDLIRRRQLQTVTNPNHAHKHRLRTHQKSQIAGCFPMLFQELTDLTSSIEPLAYAHDPKGVQKSSSCSVHSSITMAKQPAFPAAMIIITHQFMVANRFVASRKHLGNPIKSFFGEVYWLD